jgi:thiamine-phosphate pyrophosphorylase
MRTPFDLLIVSDGQPALLERLERALTPLAHGRVAVLVREPELRAGALLALSQSLRLLTSARGVRLLISDRVDVALVVRADGVQLPEAGFAVRDARLLLGPEALVGASRHSRAGLQHAADDGADYATLSPLHAVEGKAPALGHAGFAAAVAAPPLPVFALGGVQVDDVRRLLMSGAHGVAVMRAVLASADPAASTEALLRALADR